MTDQQLIALKGSIEHWRRMAKGKALKGEKPFARWCQLCTTFNSMGDGIYCVGRCDGCPVAEFMGAIGCGRTPYKECYQAYFDHGDWDDGLDSPKFKSAARKELEFLESLLPKE